MKITPQMMREQAKYMDKMNMKPIEYYFLDSPQGQYLIPVPVHQSDPRAKELLTTPIFKVEVVDE